MSFWKIVAYILVAVISIIILRLFSKPLKSFLWLSLNSLLGGVGLLIFNTLFSTFNFSIGINIVTSAVCGLLGIPGLILLIVLKLVVG